VTNNEAKQAIMGLRAMFGTQDVPTEMLTAYAAQLEQYDVEEVKVGFQRFLNTEKSPFFPSWATLRQYIEQAKARFTVDAERAWLEAYNKSGSYGHNRTPTWKDPIASVVIRDRMGGWSTFCLSEEPTQWLRKRFVEAYNETANEAIATGRLPELVKTPGRHEIENAKQSGIEGGLQQIEPRVSEDDE
jgi:hypothetical protein